MKQKILIGVTAAAITLGGLSAVWASSKEHGEKGDRLVGRIAEELELTADQKAQLADAMTSHHESMKDGRETHREFRDKMRTLSPDAADYQKQLDALVQEAQQLAKEQVLSRAQQQQKIYAILTPEQRKEFAELKQEMGRKWKEHHEGHEGYGKHHRDHECDD